MRLIDADALMRELGINDMDCGKCGWGQHGYCKRGAEFTDACFAIENAPTVEIVRCKDCIHKYINGNQIICQKLYFCDGFNFEPSNDNFCSYGERSDNVDLH